jgi:hypothetical protein
VIDRMRFVLALSLGVLLMSLVWVGGAFGGVAVDGVGLVDGGSGLWFLRDPGSGETTSFYFGDPGDVPFVGDWDCDGVDTPGLFRQSDGYVYLRNTNTQGVADRSFFFGDPGDVPLVGDFDGDGCDSVSIYRPSGHELFIVNELGADDGGLGEAEFSFVFGNPGDTPFVGDFDGDGVDTVGLHRASTGLVYFRNTLTAGNADAQFVYGDPGDVVFAGKWTDSHTTDTVGLFRPSQGTFYLNHANAQGNADEEFLYGNDTMTPIAGHFGTLPGGNEPPPGVPEKPPLVTGPVFTIGDSVMLGVACEPDRSSCLGGSWNLESQIPDLISNAAVSRNYSAAPGILSGWLKGGHDPGVVVIHLGTNGAPSTSQIDAVMAVAGNTRRVLFLTVKQSNTANQNTANARLRERIPVYPNAEIVDWYAEATAKLNMSAIDKNYGAHLWSLEARQVYVNLIRDAIEGD